MVRTLDCPASLEFHLRQMSTVETESVLTCPRCGHARREFMPTDTCQFFYECGHCKAVLRPKTGDCCVFCSYGSVSCPPVQMQRGYPSCRA